MKCRGENALRETIRECRTPATPSPSSIQPDLRMELIKAALVGIIANGNPQNIEARCHKAIEHADAMLAILERKEST